MAAKVLSKAANAEESKYECSSTEALQAKVEALNKRLQEEAFSSEGQVDERKVVTGSLDFKSWYPNMKVEVVVPIIRKRLEKGPANLIMAKYRLNTTKYVIKE